MHMTKILLITVLCTAFFLSPTASVSDQTENAHADIKDRFWALFLNGDIDSIELALDDLEAQVASGDIAHKYQLMVYDQFATTHGDIGDLIARWVEKYPWSKHSATAAMNWHKHHAWLFRGTRLASETHPRAFAAMQEHFEAAAVYGDIVLRTYPEFVPAATSYAGLFLTQLDRSLAPAFLERVFEARPSRYVLSSVVHAFHPPWGNDVGMVRRLCQTFGPMVPERHDYDAETCKAQAAIRGDIEDFGMLIAAQRLLDRHPEKFNLDARLKDAKYSRPNQDKLFALLEASGGAHLEYFSRNDIAQNPEFFEPILDRAVAHLESRLDRDPHNNRVISYLVRAIDEQYALEVVKRQRLVDRFLEQFGDRLDDPENISDEDREKLVENGREFNAFVEEIAWQTEVRVIEVETQIGETGIFDPEMWDLTARSASRGVWGDRVSLAERISSEEKAYRAAVNKLIFSNYAIRNFDTLESTMFRLMSAVKAPIRDGTNDPSVAGIDLQEIHQDYSCRAVRAQRLARHICEARDCDKDWSPGVNLIARLNNFLIDVAECPKMESAALEDLVYPEPE